MLPYRNDDYNAVLCCCFYLHCCPLMAVDNVWLPQHLLLLLWFYVCVQLIVYCLDVVVVHWTTAKGVGVTVTMENA